MKILICPDKFKECLKAGDVGLHIHKGILKAVPHADCRIIPMADGGEGTVDALVEATGGRIVTVTVHDPLMRPIESFYGVSGDGNMAIIEMAAASGLALLKPGERNPLVATSYGAGELIRNALDLGCREILVGIGGSATVDGGVGMAQALGIRFLDESGREIGPGGGNLKDLTRIDMSNADPRLMQSKVFAACDVSSPLTGVKGAAVVFGPQKGASPAMVKQLDNNLTHMARLIKDLWHLDVDNLPGAGAAGGMGAGIVAFLHGKLKPGFDLVSQKVKLVEWIRWTDLVITGEGKMDFQTAYGKVPAGVAGLASKFDRPVIVFTGAIGDAQDKYQPLEYFTVLPIVDKPMTLEQSIADAGRLLENAAERTFRIMELGRRL
jgi:glycerate 2-kinase